jgi:multicomponent Na+:H+ antiporter subunit B
VKTQVRLTILGTGLALFAALLCWGLRGIPAAGHYRGPYGDVVNAVGQSERNVTDMVSAVNFDYRSIDTLGEEYILFTSVVGASVVLRRMRSEKEGGAEEEEAVRPSSRTSDAVRITSLLTVAGITVLGIYIVSHGQLSPGGGFQGGAILGSALTMVFMAGGYRRMRRIGPQAILEVADSLGAGGFAAVGVAGLASGAAMLSNVLPLGTSGDLTAGGTIPLISFAVGLEVAGGILVVIKEFLLQAMQIREPGTERR